MTSNDNDESRDAPAGDPLADPIDVDRIDDTTPIHDNLVDELGIAPVRDSATLKAVRRSRIGAAFRLVRRRPQSP